MDIENKITDLYNEIINLQDKKKEIERQIGEKMDLMKHFHSLLKSIRYTSTFPQKRCTYNPSSQDNNKYSNPLWLSKKEIVLKRDGYRCKICGSTTALEVHHIDYKDENGNYVKDEIWLSPLSHLISLCHECHTKFNGTKCEDAIFIVADPPILLSKKRESNRTDLELVNPDWNEVYNELRWFNLDNDYCHRKSLILTVLNPEATKIGREILQLPKEEGINELDRYKFINRFKDQREIISFGNELIRLQKEYPSTEKNCSFILKRISPLIKQCQRPPEKGIIHFNSKSKANGYFIAFYDIESNQFVKAINMSNCTEYCNPKNKNDYKFFSQFLAIEYVMNRCKKTGEKTYELPIFPNDPNGDLSYIDNDKVIEDVERRIKDKNLYKRIKEIIDRIDFNNFYLYDDWKYNVWGDIPTKKFRGKKIKNIDLSHFFSYGESYEEEK